MRPIRTFEFACAEDTRPDARAEGEHGELQSEEFLDAERLIVSGHRHVEGVEADVEHNEYGEQRSDTRVGEHATIAATRGAQTAAVECDGRVGAGFRPATGCTQHVGVVGGCGFYLHHFDDGRCGVA